MKTDVILKYAFKNLRDSLKHMTHDTRAKIVDAAPLELVEVNRRLDMVWKLEKDQQTFYRNIEFNAGGRGVISQSFLYNVLASAQLGTPVLTTIIQLGPPRLKPTEIYEVKVGRRIVLRWSFDAVNLFDLPAEKAVRSKSLGYLALVPLMKGGTPEQIAQALRVLQRLQPTAMVADAQVLLLNLAERRYPDSDLRGLMTKEQLMQSILFEEIRAEGRAEGRDEGRLAAERELCLEMLREFHPALVAPATPVVAACSDPSVIRKWILLTPKTHDDAELARLMDLRPTRGTRGSRCRRG